MRGDRFTACIQPNPQRLANPLHFLMVGSSRDSSALDGFSITNVTAPSPPPTLRVRRNRKRRSSEKIAPPSRSSIGSAPLQPLDHRVADGLGGGAASEVWRERLVRVDGVQHGALDRPLGVGVSQVA